MHKQIQIVFTLLLMGISVTFVFGQNRCSPCSDADGDGYGNGLTCHGPDCDDSDSEVYPTQRENCTDKIDNDCDLLIDDDDIECQQTNLVAVPEGWFFRGTCNEGSDPPCSEGDPGYSRSYQEIEMPRREIYLTGYFIDAYEVSVGDFRVCLESGACQEKWIGTYYDATFCNYDKPARENHPINCASWYAADQYCQFAGKRLPTEAEWEKAARGIEGYRYPWGHGGVSCSVANYRYLTNTFCVGDTAPVDSYPEGASPYGAYNMGGNLWEWVHDWYHPDYYDESFPFPDFSPNENPQGPKEGTLRMIRGGSWVTSEGFIRTAPKHFYEPDMGVEDVGFRCVRSME